MQTISKNSTASNAPTWTSEKQAERTRGKTPRKAFVVNIEPRLMADLSPRACKLLLALLHRADGHSGDLKLPQAWNRAEPYWFTGKDFEKWAKMSEPTRLLAVRELIERGFLTMVRPRIHQIVEGRLRATAGHTQYTLHRKPIASINHQKGANSSKLKAAPVLQNSTSTGHEEVGQEFFQNTPSCAGASSVSVFHVSENPLATHNHHHHHPKPDEDDDVSTKEFSTSTPRPNPKDSVEEETTPQVPPALRAWMNTQILARAFRPVKSRSAYLRASYPAFLENLGEEIELYLQSKAEKFMVERIEEKGSVDSDSVYDFLVEEAEKYALPIGLWAEGGQESEEFSVTREEPDSVYWRIYENAADVLGLKNADEGDQR